MARRVAQRGQLSDGVLGSSQPGVDSVQHSSFKPSSSVEA